LPLEALSDPGLFPSSFILDDSRGSNFKNIAAGWAALRKRVVYASPASAVLFGFVKFILDGGRSPVGSAAESPWLIEAMEARLKEDGLSLKDQAYYLRHFRMGVFFHHELLSPVANAMMLEAFRRLEPERNEPFVLATSGSLAYGATIPASALLMDAVFWPRRRLDGAVSMELMDPGFLVSFIGRVSPGKGEGERPLAFINWPMWRDFSKGDRRSFSVRRGKMASLFRGGDKAEAGPFELHSSFHHAKHFKELKDYPLPLQELFLHGLHHASRLKRMGQVKLADVLEFLEETVIGRSFVSRRPAENTAELANRMANYYGGLSSAFSGLVAEEERIRIGSGRLRLRHRAGPVLQGLVGRRVDPVSLLELARAAEGFPEDSPWRGPALYGLAGLVLSPLARTMQECFPRSFHLPSVLRPHELESARTETVPAHLFFRGLSAPFNALLEGRGVEPTAAKEMSLKILSIANAAAKEALERDPRLQGGPRLFTAVRDQVLEYIFPMEERLLKWLGGEDLSSLQESMCQEDDEIGSRACGAAFSFSFRRRVLDVFECFALYTESLEARRGGGAAGPLSGSVGRMRDEFLQRLAPELPPTSVFVLERLVTGGGPSRAEDARVAAGAAEDRGAAGAAEAQ
jgi:hypothetical protein